MITRRYPPHWSFLADSRKHEAHCSIVWGSYGVGGDLYPIGEKPTERNTGACPAKCLFTSCFGKGLVPVWGEQSLNPQRGGQSRSFGLIITPLPGRASRTKSVLSMPSRKNRVLPSTNAATTPPGCPEEGRVLRSASSSIPIPYQMSCGGVNAGTLNFLSHTLPRVAKLWER